MTDDVSDTGTGRRARLLATKLAALVRASGVDDELVSGAFPPGAALRAGDRAWVLLDTEIDDGAGLGPAIIWALRNGAVSLDVVADVALGTAARRAAEFDLPIRVWVADGRQIDVVAASPVVVAPEPRSEHLALATEIEAAGATVVVEHGVVTGEVRGLEVCRVVDAAGPDGPVVRLEVGVGVHDREAFTMIHGDVPTAEALSGVVEAVAQARDPDAPGHPLDRLAPERALRWRLEQQPWLVGMATVAPAQPPVPRRGLKERVPCTARGERLDGTPAVIVCSVGVDLDVVPYAADARLSCGSVSGGPVDTLIVLPRRDLLPATVELAARLRDAPTLVTPDPGAVRS